MGTRSLSCWTDAAQQPIIRLLLDDAVLKPAVPTAAPTLQPPQAPESNRFSLLKKPLSERPELFGARPPSSGQPIR